MTFVEAQELSKRWGDTPCSHPHLEQEAPMFGQRTGDYYCTQCGMCGVGRDWNRRRTAAPKPK
jgi:hypothetical protein